MVDVTGAMFCPSVRTGRRNSTVTSRSSAQSRSARHRKVISASPESCRLMIERCANSRCASSCCVRPAPRSSMTAFRSSRRTRPISRAAFRDRAEMSKRKNVIGRAPFYAQTIVDTELSAQPPDRDPVAAIEIMIFDRVGPVAEHGSKTILGEKPAEDPHIRCLQLPHGIVLDADGPKLSFKDQRRPAKEQIEQIFDLPARRHVGERTGRGG